MPRLRGFNVKNFTYPGRFFFLTRHQNCCIIHIRVCNVRACAINHKNLGPEIETSQLLISPPKAQFIKQISVFQRNRVLCIRRGNQIYRVEDDKMNRKIRKIAIPLIWILIYVFTIPTQLSSYVLCIGADGHVKIEEAINGQCTDTPASPCKQSTLCFAEAPASEGHCGSCLDIPIFMSVGDEEYVVPTQNPSPSYSVSTVAVIASPQTTAAPISTVNTFPNLPLRIPPTLAPLRTVILLI